MEKKNVVRRRDPIKDGRSGFSVGISHQQGWWILRPDVIGDLISLKNLSLSSNSFSGSIPDSVSALPSLIHMDLSSNQLNGTIPKFISQMKSLKHLNLANNNLHGVVPFNLSFIKRLDLALW